MLSLKATGSTNGMFSKAGWLIVLLAIAVMYGPTYWAAAGSTWQSEDNAHGALVLVVVFWLFWRQRVVISQSPTNPANALGGACFALGLLFYVYGRTLESRSFEFLSPAFVVGGLLMVMKGRTALAAAWFPIFYLLFTIPLPTVVIDTLTGPLKQWISVIVERALYWVGYPISRAGVVIHIGQYQLLVADACSGLHSMFSMTVIGTLYVYLRGNPSRIHNVILLLLILPLAFIMNIIRVTLLVLITYYLGDEAGQGILHGTVGIVLMLFSLLCLFGLDQIFGPQTRSSRLALG